MTISVGRALAIVICVIGIPANIAVILALLLSKVCKGVGTKWYILQLAIADMIFLITIAVRTEYSSNKKEFSIYGCRFINTSFYVNYHSSVLFVTIMAIDRYAVICHHTSQIVQRLRQRRPVIITTIFAWLISFVVSLPALLYSDVTYGCRILFPLTSELPTSSINGPPPQCEIAKRQHGEFVYYLFEFIVMFLAPVVITSICYAFIINRAVKSRFTGSGLTMDSKRKRAIVTSVTLVLAFIICWTPHHVKILALMKGIHATTSYCKTLAVVTTILVYLNSAVNPFIYFIMIRIGEQLRALKEKSARCFCCNNTEERNTSIVSFSNERSERNKAPSSNEEDS